jgi:hypothetical protein
MFTQMMSGDKCFHILRGIIRTFRDNEHRFKCWNRLNNPRESLHVVEESL